MLYLVVRPDGSEHPMEVSEFHEDRWRQVECKIRRCQSATRGEQLLLLRYCRLYGEDVDAQGLWMLAAGVPADTIIPELMPSIVVELVR